MDFILISFGMVALIVVLLVLLARAYPGSGADLAELLEHSVHHRLNRRGDVRPRTDAAQQIRSTDGTERAKRGEPLDMG